MRRAILLLAMMAVALVGIVAVQASAQEGSRDRQPPDAALMQGSQILQTGRQGSFCWSYSEGEVWGAVCADYVPSFPAAARVEAGSQLYISLRKPQRPDKFRIYAYRDVDQDGFPIGDAQRLSTSLERVVRDGRTVGWDVLFSVNRPDRHYYLEAYGEWDYMRGSKASFGQSSWYFHVKTLS
jgi:hypothetical protein